MCGGNKTVRIHINIQRFNRLADKLCMKKKTSVSSDYPLHTRIQYLRRLRDLTQAELAKRSGITQGSLAHFEAGKNSPSVKTLVALAAGLEISPAIFFTNDDVLVFDLKKMKAKYKSLSEMPDKLYRDLNTIALVAKKYGL